MKTTQNVPDITPFDTFALKLADYVSIQINSQVQPVANFPYTKQYTLEQVVKILKDRV